MKTKNIFPQKLARLLPHDSPSAPLRTEEFEADAHLSGSPKQWAKELGDVGFTSLKISGSALELSLVQSLDLQGQPHQSIHLRLSPARLRLSFSVAPHQNATRRRIEAARLLLLTLSALRSPIPSTLSAFLAQTLQEALDAVSVESDELAARVRELEESSEAAAARMASLQSQRELDAKKMVADAHQLEEMQTRLRQLETLPNSALDEEVMEWLRSHDGQISIRQVAALHNLAPARVEQSLDRLCKSGFIARKNTP